MNVNAVWHAFVIVYIIATGWSSACGATMTTNREVLIKDQGKIIFYENTWTLSFYLNLKSYVENAIILENSTNNLLNLCNIMSTKNNCQFFIDNLREEAQFVQRDIERIRQFSRSKRFAWGAIFKGIAREALVCFGVIAVTETMNESRMTEVRAQLEANRELVQAQLNITKMQNEIISDTTSQIAYLHHTVQNLNQTTINTNKFNELLHVATTALNKHTKQTMKLINILNGDLRAQFFNVIETDIFQNETSNINRKLLPRAKLPASNPQDLLDLSRISSNTNETHITIFIKIPIITNKSYDLFEYIPIPIITDSTVHILNTNAKYFFKAELNKTKYIPLSALTRCNTINTQTFCNSIIEEELREVNPCMESIIANSSNYNCKYREIPYQNYIMRLSANTIFCFIIKPIALRIVCNEKTSIHELEGNTEINFSKQCDLHRISNEFHYDSNSYSSVEINYPLIQPNFTIYDTKYEKWISNLTIINRNNIKMLKINNEIEVIDSKVASEPEQHPTGFLHSITDFGYSTVNYIRNLFTANNFLNFCIYVLPPLVVTGLIYILCYRIRSFSFQQ